MEKIKLIENILTWQGEGPDNGKRMLLLRFKNCNMNCAYCDTMVKMRATQEAEYLLTDIQNVIDREGCGLMITGGEPTLGKQREATENMLNSLDYPIANVESNGFKLIEMIERVDTNKPVNFMYSPKIFIMDQLEDNMDKTQRLIDYDNVYIKLVCDKDYELTENYLNFLDRINFPKQRVFLMPEGVSREELIAHAGHVFDLAEKYKFNFSSREHLIFNFI